MGDFPVREMLSLMITTDVFPEEMGMAEIGTLRKTALNAVHRAAKSKMVDFGGWDMPVDCCGLTAEHMAVRTAVGVDRKSVV